MIQETAEQPKRVRAIGMISCTHSLAIASVLALAFVLPLASFGDPASESQHDPLGTETPAAAASENSDRGEWQELLRGIRYREIHAGDGIRPSLWAAVYVHYRLVAENGRVLEDTYSSESHGNRARKHMIGSGTMPEALELVVGSMRERGRREILIPADLLNVADFHSHDQTDENGNPVHDTEEHDLLAAALKPGTSVRGEISLLWVRPFNPEAGTQFR